MAIPHHFVTPRHSPLASAHCMAIDPPRYSCIQVKSVPRYVIYSIMRYLHRLGNGLEQPADFVAAAVAFRLKRATKFISGSRVCELLARHLLMGGGNSGGRGASGITARQQPRESKGWRDQPTPAEKSRVPVASTSESTRRNMDETRFV